MSKLRAILALTVLTLASCASPLIDTSNKTDQPGAPTVKNYDVTFNSHGGDGTMEKQSIPAGETQNLRPNAFAKDNCDFAGWSLTESGAVAYADGAAITMGDKPVTLYAVWTELPSTAVIFKPNGGSGTMADQTIANGATAALQACSFVRDTYGFIGWSTSPDGTVPYADGASFTMGPSATILYARWLPNSATSGNNFTATFANAQATITAYTGNATAVEVPPLIKDAASGIWYPVTVVKAASRTKGGFVNKKTLASVILPDTITAIGNYAFYGCSSLASVNLPATLISIDMSAFESCTSIESIAIPASVDGIGSYAFWKCSGLTAFSVAAGNEIYMAQGGMLMTADGLVIVAYPPAKADTRLVIDGAVECIDSRAFYGCKNLVEVDIQAPLIDIGGMAFNGCTGLKSVTLSAVTPPTLGDDAVFDNNGGARSFSVPESATADYRGATNWAEYAADINPAASNKLIAPIPVNKGYFGDALVLSRDGSTLAVTDENGGSGYNSLVHVFVKSGDAWNQTATIELPDSALQQNAYDETTLNDRSLALSSDGKTMLVSLPMQDQARVYTSADRANWSLSATLTLSALQADQYFGYSVDLSADGSVALIGCISDDSYKGGMAYVFVRGSSWADATETATLTQSTNPDFTFGSQVSLSSDGNLAAVSAPSLTTEFLYKGETYNMFPTEGVVFLYQTSAHAWADMGETAKVIVEDFSIEKFGTDIDLSDDGKILLASSKNRAFIFEGTTPSTFTKTAELTASDAGNLYAFGKALSLSADGTTALVGDYNNGSAGNKYGAAYLYRRSGTAWANGTESKKLMADATTPARADDFFGDALGLSADGTLAIVSAWQADFDVSESAIEAPGIVYFFPLNE